jgi:hypothetical protein
MSTRYAQAIAIAMLTIVSTASARAQDKVATGEPWILDSNNWQQAQGLLPEPCSSA